MPTPDFVHTKTKKSVLTLRTLLMFRLLLGLYYELSSSPLICWIARLFCIFCTIWNVFVSISYVTFLEPHNTMEIIFAMLLVIEITANGLLSILTGEKDILKFSAVIRSEFTSRSTPASSYIAYSTIAMVVIARYIAVAIVSTTTTEVLVYVIYNYTYLGCISSNLTSLYLTDTYRKNIYFMKETLKLNLQDVNSEDDHRTTYVKQFLNNYKKLAKCFATTWDLMRLRIIIGLLFAWLKLVTEICYAAMATWHDGNIPFGLYIAATIIVTCMSFIMMELAANYLDEIKQILADQLLMPKEKELQGLVHDALDYIDASSARFTLWNNIPMTVNTVLGIFSLSISYVIVILQFVY